MAFIYDLDNEGGGQILADAGTVQPALKVDNNAAGYSAIAVLSTASASAVQISGIMGAGIDADAKDSTAVAGDFRSNATGGTALLVGSTVVGSPTIAAFKVLHPSVASGAVMELGGGFISCTSVILTTVANIDYVFPVSLNGNIRYIPVLKGAGISGGAAL